MASLGEQKLPRVGQIGFINSLPVTLPIDRRLVDIGAELVLDTPTGLNARYAEGSLDLGAMSTFFYLKSRSMTLIPRLSISGDGAVGSVLYFGKNKPNKAKPFRIAVPFASATSVCLVQVLFMEQFGIMPQTVPMEKPNLGDDVDGALVIGDYALSVDADWSGLYDRQDLGKWWNSIFDLPMVFGLWASRTSFSERHPVEFSAISDGLVQALNVGLGDAFADVVEEAHKRTGHSIVRLEHYYRHELDFTFTDRHRVALEKYESLCIQHGLLNQKAIISGQGISVRT
jgi:chorismate dehydratase